MFFFSLGWGFWGLGFSVGSFQALGFCTFELWVLRFRFRVRALGCEGFGFFFRLQGEARGSCGLPTSWSSGYPKP